MIALIIFRDQLTIFSICDSRFTSYFFIFSSSNFISTIIPITKSKLSIELFIFSFLSQFSFISCSFLIISFFISIEKIAMIIFPSTEFILIFLIDISYINFTINNLRTKKSECAFPLAIITIFFIFTSEGFNGVS